MDYDTRYMNKQLWEENLDTSSLKNKVPLIFSWIPPDVTTILDIGCGNGILTNALAQNYDVTGVDFSLEALQYVTGKKIHSSAAQIPVDEKSYDMVFSSEMLEHLSDDNLNKAISEIKRIAKKYIFITVPNNEFLESLFVKCNKCHFTFHKYGHLQSFDVNRLNSIVGVKFRLLKSGLYGSERKTFNPFLLNIRTKIANVWSTADKFTYCPNCGNNDFGKKRKTILSRCCHEINQVISKKSPYWLFVLYERIEE